MVQMVFVALTIVVGTSVADVGMAHHTAQAQPGTACAALASDERPLLQEITDLSAPEAPGALTLCLLDVPAEAVQQAVILGVDSPELFRSAKAAAIDRLAVAGVDLCRVAVWEGRGARVLPLTLEDQLDLPVTCPPRLIAADSGALEWLQPVMDSVARLRDLTSAQLGWQPNRALTVRVFTDIDAAIPAFQRYVGTAVRGETPEHIAQTTRSGFTWHVINTTEPGWGTVMLINLTRPADRTLAVIARQVAVDYTGFALSGIGGTATSSPQWYRQGFDDVQAERNAGSALGSLSLATQQARAGTAAPLRELSRIEDWTAHRLADGDASVQARCQAAVLYLIEHYGVDATLQLLRDNRGGDFDRFADLLKTLTGMDIDAFNAAVDTWLQSAPATLTARGAAVHLDVLVSPGMTLGEATVTFDRAISCGGGRMVVAGTKVTVPITLNSDGSFTATGLIGNATVTIEGRLTGGAVTGSVRFLNPATGCDTGALTLA
ncbi:MAG TPA: hypothetical protein VFD32_11500 [Dehalococcoidia bacterium]|nr:hypothetical protein [Dehalococcoidia bacterium]